ncbi:MAG: guanylate kinase [Deltaproteobacteria bacterium]|nr:guanylate kinase [Deltaproteobacteria bacterium]
MLFVISAPSGTGKTTLVKRLLKELPRLRLSVSTTTRPPRKGEVEGVDYHFVSLDEFNERKKKGEFIESAEVHGACYGTSQYLLQRDEEEQYDTLFDIDTQGALNLKKERPEAILIFLMPPSLADLEERLKKRGTEGEADLKRRLARAQSEMAVKDHYDYVIMNDKLEEAYKALKGLIEEKRQKKNALS